MAEVPTKSSKCHRCWEDIQTEGSAFFCMTCEGELCENCTRSIFSHFSEEDANKFLGALHQAGEMTCWGACPFCYGYLPTKFQVLDDILKRHDERYTDVAAKLAFPAHQKNFLFAAQTHYAKMLAARIADAKSKIAKAEKDVVEEK